MSNHSIQPIKSSAWIWLLIIAIGVLFFLLKPSFDIFPERYSNYVRSTAVEDILAPSFDPKNANSVGLVNMGVCSGPREFSDKVEPFKMGPRRFVSVLFDDGRLFQYEITSASASNSEAPGVQFLYSNLKKERHNREFRSFRFGETTPAEAEQRNQECLRTGTRLEGMGEYFFAFGSSAPYGGVSDMMHEQGVFDAREKEVIRQAAFAMNDAIASQKRFKEGQQSWTKN